MTLGYRADALEYDPDGDCYLLRADFAPSKHRIKIEFGTPDGCDAHLAGWNGPDDPPIAHVRDMMGTPLRAGHAYVADRLKLTAPDGGTFLVDTLEIEHEVVGLVVGKTLVPGDRYRITHDDSSTQDDIEDPAGMSGFGPGTMIATAEGELPVDWLAPGDRIATFDHGLQTLRWIGYSRVTARQMAQDSGLTPVQIDASHFGRNSPDKPLILSPDTRLLLTGAQIQLNFGVDQALVRARDLTRSQASPQPAQALTFFTLLFDAHQVVRANGVWCESLFTGACDLHDPARHGPGHPDGIDHTYTAHMCLREWEAGLLRHLHRPEMRNSEARAA